MTTDLSWKAVAANLVAIGAVGYLFTSIGRTPNWPMGLLALFAFVVIASAAIGGVFWLFRRKKETPLLKRSFVIAAWVIMGLIILGERS